jgi:acyl-CoA synthetase (AMP-forming)/AMP-acid ligase II
VFIETFDPVESPLVMAEHGATLLGSALPFFQAYIAAQRRHGDTPLFPALRGFVSGGAPKPPEIYYELKDLFGVPTISGWGLTEFPIATTSTVDDTEEELAETEGRLVPGVELRVVAMDGRDVPAGFEGELRVKGPQMIAGYVDATLDEHAFDEQGFFRTGDLGILGPRGHVRVTGRLKDVIIRNAENISALEIESVLYEHPKVADVAVIGVPDRRTGERACAVVVLEPNASTITLNEIAAFCRERQLANQKIPEQVEIVDVLPRNAMGKILKQDLRQRFGA